VGGTTKNTKPIFITARRKTSRPTNANGCIREQSVTCRALWFFRRISQTCVLPALLFCFRQVKNARAPLGPEYIAKVALKAMAEADNDIAQWKAHFLRGAAATHFMAKGVPSAVVQAWGGWKSAATMATHHARQHQLITWAELSPSPPDLALGPEDIASSSQSLLRRASPHSVYLISLGIKIWNHCWMLEIVRDEG